MFINILFTDKLCNELLPVNSPVLFTRNGIYFHGGNTVSFFFMGGNTVMDINNSLDFSYAKLKSQVL